MALYLVFNCVCLFACSERHTFTITYTEINGQTIARIPEVSAVATLDGLQIDYYDSVRKKLIPKQDWVAIESRNIWKDYTEIREQVRQINKINITVLMQQLNQSHGVHVYQRMYGCVWDYKTNDSDGFDQHGYDGEDFITLDLKKLRYNSPVPQGIPIVQKWNNDSQQLQLLKQYCEQDRIDWIKYFLELGKDALERKGSFSSRNSLCFIKWIIFDYNKLVIVSLVQKNSSSPVVCHATGFYPSEVNITWLRNGEEHYEDVELGELLPNEDRTFQKTSTLSIYPDEWKKHQYVCVVEHKTGTIQKNLTEDEIRSNKNVRMSALHNLDLSMLHGKMTSCYKTGKF
ncbi:hypothetical protein cypCar_00039920, partial [Cyprinus carpio]